MTDQQVFDLAAQKSPQSLSLEEVLALRKWLMESPSQRKMLLGEMQLETYFSEAFDLIHSSVQIVLTEAARKIGE